MIQKFYFLLLSALLNLIFSYAQQPHYKPKPLVSEDNPKEFVVIAPKKDGLMRTYLLISPEIWDVDDDNTTYIRGGQKALVCIEGPSRNGKQQGVFTAYVMAKDDHAKRYKIWEQNYANGQLNGEWKTFGLHGKLVRKETYKNDSLSGIARDYWIDGQTVMEERVYENGRSKFLQRQFGPNGKVAEETTIANGFPNGPAKKYYEDGTLQDEVTLLNGLPNGLRRYYYPSGKVWIETEMKRGKPWTVIANYTEAGQMRDAGTLKDGNGTLIFYNQDGSVRETAIYKNGEPVQQ